MPWEVIEAETERLNGNRWVLVPSGTGRVDVCSLAEAEPIAHRLGLYINEPGTVGSKAATLGWSVPE